MGCAVATPVSLCRQTAAHVKESVSIVGHVSLETRSSDIQLSASLDGQMCCMLVCYALLSVIALQIIFVDMHIINV